MSQLDKNAKGFIARHIGSIMTHAAAAIFGAILGIALAT